MIQKIRWGVLGTARIGEQQVIPAIQQSKNGEVVAVASRNLDTGKIFAARLNIPKAYGSYEQLLADPEIDSVYIPLPNDQHYTWSMRSAEAGKPVLCEKPLTLTSDEAQHVADVFAARNLQLAEAFMYRFHPQTEKVKQMIDSGAIGKIQFMNATFNFSIGSENDIRLDQQRGGGALLDVGCYCINIIRYLIGDEPIRVQAFADFGIQSRIDESVVGILSFPSGALAHFDCGIRTHFTQNYEVRGTHGRILVEKAFVPFRPDPGADIIIRCWRSVPGIEKEEYEELKINPVNQYTLMVEDFADAVLNKRASRFSIQDSIANMRVIDQLISSAHANDADNHTCQDRD